MATKQSGWAEDVQLTLPWQRFAQLTMDGTLSKEELSQLKNQGRILFIDDFHGEQEPKKEEADNQACTGSQAKTVSEQKNRKRPRETIGKKAVRPRQDQPRKTEAKTTRVQGKNASAKESGEGKPRGSVRGQVAVQGSTTSQDEKEAPVESDDDWGGWSAGCALPVAQPPADKHKQEKQLPIGASRHVESWLTYN